MADDPFPVTWSGRRAVVAFPGHVDVSNVGQLRDEDLPAEMVRRRLGETLTELDEVIREVRDYAFTLGNRRRPD